MTAPPDPTTKPDDPCCLDAEAGSVARTDATGRQDMVPGVPLKHGVSITDACIGFAQTVPVLQALAAAVRARRSQPAR